MRSARYIRSINSGVPAYQTWLHCSYPGKYPGTKPGCRRHTRVYTRVPKYPGTQPGDIRHTRVLNTWVPKYPGTKSGYKRHTRVHPSIHPTKRTLASHTRRNAHEAQPTQGRTAEGERHDENTLSLPAAFKAASTRLSLQGGGVQNNQIYLHTVFPPFEATNARRQGRERVDITLVPCPLSPARHNYRKCQ